MRCDVTEWDDQQALVARALDAYGRLDVAFANAGFGGARGFKAGTPEEWKEMVLTNVYGAALTIRAALRRARRDARATCCSRRRSPAAARCPGSLYSVTKHAVTAMGEAARQDFNDTGVRVTLIEPGMVDTPFFDNPPQIARAGGRRHRPRGAVRRAAAAARRRQRDPDQADGAAGVSRAAVACQASGRVPARARLQATLLGAGSTEITRPRRPSRNCTMPADLAKIVSSRPMPTPSPGLKRGAALAHDDLAAGDDLAGEDLHAEALGVGVAAVAAGAEALLVCHLVRTPS